MAKAPVIGRFAPSPTGDLHFGSLLAAVGSYLEVKSVNGKCLLRIEDIDPPREIQGSAVRIIADLGRLGMIYNGPILFQSGRSKAYQVALDRLLKLGLAYPCACTRKDIPADGKYPGTCANGIAKGKKARSIRFRVGNSSFDFVDKLQGRIVGRPADQTGDFIIRRADGLFAYQLAVVVDDAYQGVNQVVRGSDLLDSTGRQICLQNALGLETPTYMHLPVAVIADGRKLSKRLGSDPVKDQNAAHAVESALRFLGQKPPQDKPLETLWQWAIEHWNSDLVPRHKTIMLDSINQPGRS